MTTWFRPLTGPLREAGIPKPTARHAVFELDTGTGRYVRIKPARAAKSVQAAKPAEQPA